MKAFKLLLISLLLVSIVSCEEDAPTAKEKLVKNAIVFSAKGTEHTSNYNLVTINKNINQDGYSLHMTGIEDIKDGNPTFGVTLWVLFRFNMLPSTYVIPNYVGEYDLNLVSGGYSEGSSNGWVNNACDTLLNNSAEDRAGELVITNINTTTKKISGTFKMSVCRNEEDHLYVEGYFNDLDYTLYE